MASTLGTSVCAGEHISRGQESLWPELAEDAGSRGSLPGGSPTTLSAGSRTRSGGGGREAGAQDRSGASTVRREAAQRSAARAKGRSGSRGAGARAQREADGGGAPGRGGDPAPGLVICPKTRRSTAFDVPDTPAQAFDLGFRFPSATEVADAGVAAELLLRGDVACGPRLARVGSGELGYDRRAGAEHAMLSAVRAIGFERSDQDSVHAIRVSRVGRLARSGFAWSAPASSGEGLTFSLRIASGAVSLSAVNPDRVARAIERAAARSVGESALSIRLAEWISDRAPVGTDPTLWWSGLDDDARRSMMRQAASAVGAVHLADRVLSSREITEWSRKSRANMIRALAEIDYAPVLSASGVPAMVTLTYPGDWEAVAPTGRAVKAHVDAFRHRFSRRYGTLNALWKLEFQARGAPHVHLWMPLPTERIIRRKGQAAVVVSESGAEFRTWLSSAWADVVSHPDPEQRRRHERAGTAVDVVEGLRARDPKRLAIYFSKHSAAQLDTESGGKEYQHSVPKLWQAPGAGPGRFWGYWGLRRVVSSVTLSVEDFVQARRLMRRWARSRAAYRPGERYPVSVSPLVQRKRVRRGAGYRWSTTRRVVCGQGRLVGGFLCVTTGPGFGMDLVQGLRASVSRPPLPRQDRWW